MKSVLQYSKQLLVTCSFVFLFLQVKAQTLQPGTIVAPLQPMCLGGTVGIITSGADASGGTGSIFYIWESSYVSPTTGYISLGSNTPTYNPGSLSQTTYFRRAAMTATDAMVYSNVVSIVVNSNPEPTFTVAGPALLSTSSATMDMLSFCEGGSYSFSVSSTGVNTYNWILTGGTSLNLPPVPTFTVNDVTNANGGLYGCVVTNSNGCSTTVYRNCSVQFMDILFPNNSPYSFCEGKKAKIVVYTASGGTNFIWKWPNANTSSGEELLIPAVDSSSAGIYTVECLSMACPLTKTINLSILPAGDIKIIPSSTIVCAGQNLTLTPIGGLPHSYSWISPYPSPHGELVLQPAITWTYVISGRGANNCTSEGSVVVMVDNNCDTVPEIVEPSALVFPNPSTDTGGFNVSADQPITLALINSLGQIIEIIELNSGNNLCFFIPKLEEGIYYIVRRGSGNFKSKKIVVLGHK